MDECREEFSSTSPSVPTSHLYLQNMPPSSSLLSSPSKRHHLTRPVVPMSSPRNVDSSMPPNETKLLILAPMTKADTLHEFPVTSQHFSPSCFYDRPIHSHKSSLPPPPSLPYESPPNPALLAKPSRSWMPARSRPRGRMSDLNTSAPLGSTPVLLDNETACPQPSQLDPTKGSTPTHVAAPVSLPPNNNDTTVEGCASTASSTQHEHNNSPKSFPASIDSPPNHLNDNTTLLPTNPAHSPSSSLASPRASSRRHPRDAADADSCLWRTKRKPARRDGSPASKLVVTLQAAAVWGIDSMCASDGIYDGVCGEDISCVNNKGALMAPSSCVSGSRDEARYAVTVAESACVSPQSFIEGIGALELMTATAAPANGSSSNGSGATATKDCGELIGDNTSPTTSASAYRGVYGSSGRCSDTQLSYVSSDASPKPLDTAPSSDGSRRRNSIPWSHSARGGIVQVPHDNAQGDLVGACGMRHTTVWCAPTSALLLPPVPLPTPPTQPQCTRKWVNGSRHEPTATGAVDCVCADGTAWPEIELYLAEMIRALRASAWRAQTLLVHALLACTAGRADPEASVEGGCVGSGSDDVRGHMRADEEAKTRSPSEHARQHGYGCGRECGSGYGVVLWSIHSSMAVLAASPSVDLRTRAPRYIPYPSSRAPARLLASPFSTNRALLPLRPIPGAPAPSPPQTYRPLSADPLVATVVALSARNAYYRAAAVAPTARAPLPLSTPPPLPTAARPATSLSVAMTSSSRFSSRASSPPSVTSSAFPAPSTSLPTSPPVFDPLVLICTAMRNMHIRYAAQRQRSSRSRAHTPTKRHNNPAHARAAPPTAPQRVPRPLPSPTSAPRTPSLLQPHAPARSSPFTPPPFLPLHAQHLYSSSLVHTDTLSQSSFPTTDHSQPTALSHPRLSPPSSPSSSCSRSSSSSSSSSSCLSSLSINRAPSPSPSSTTSLSSLSSYLPHEIPLLTTVPNPAAFAASHWQPLPITPITSLSVMDAATGTATGDAAALALWRTSPDGGPSRTRDGAPLSSADTDSFHGSAGDDWLYDGNRTPTPVAASRALPPLATRSLNTHVRSLASPHRPLRSTSTLLRSIGSSLALGYLTEAARVHVSGSAATLEPLPATIYEPQQSWARESSSSLSYTSMHISGLAQLRYCSRGAGAETGAELSVGMNDGAGDVVGDRGGSCNSARGDSGKEVSRAGVVVGMDMSDSHGRYDGDGNGVWSPPHYPQPPQGMFAAENASNSSSLSPPATGGDRVQAHAEWQSERPRFSLSSLLREDDGDVRLDNPSHVGVDSTTEEPRPSAPLPRAHMPLAHGPRWNGEGTNSEAPVLVSRGPPARDTAHTAVARAAGKLWAPSTHAPLAAPLAAGQTPVEGYEHRHEHGRDGANAVLCSAYRGPVHGYVRTVLPSLPSLSSLSLLDHPQASAEDEVLATHDTHTLGTDAACVDANAQGSPRHAGTSPPLEDRYSYVSSVGPAATSRSPSVAAAASRPRAYTASPQRIPWVLAPTPPTHTPSRSDSSSMLPCAPLSFLVDSHATISLDGHSARDHATPLALSVAQNSVGNADSHADSQEYLRDSTLTRLSLLSGGIVSHIAASADTSGAHTHMGCSEDLMDGSSGDHASVGRTAYTESMHAMSVQSPLHGDNERVATHALPRSDRTLILDSRTTISSALPSDYIASGANMLGGDTEWALADATSHSSHGGLRSGSVAVSVRDSMTGGVGGAGKGAPTRTLTAHVHPHPSHLPRARTMAGASTRLRSGSSDTSPLRGRPLSLSLCSASPSLSSVRKSPRRGSPSPHRLLPAHMFDGEMTPDTASPESEEPHGAPALQCDPSLHANTHVHHSASTSPSSLTAVPHISISPPISSHSPSYLSHSSRAPPHLRTRPHPHPHRAYLHVPGTASGTEAGRNRGKQQCAHRGIETKSRCKQRPPPDLGTRSRANTDGEADSFSYTQSSTSAVGDTSFPSDLPHSPLPPASLQVSELGLPGVLCDSLRSLHTRAATATVASSDCSSSQASSCAPAPDRQRLHTWWWTDDVSQSSGKTSDTYGSHMLSSGMSESSTLYVQAQEDSELCHAHGYSEHQDGDGLDGCHVTHEAAADTGNTAVVCRDSAHVRRPRVMSVHEVSDEDGDYDESRCASSFHQPLLPSSDSAYAELALAAPPLPRGTSVPLYCVQTEYAEPVVETKGKVSLPHTSATPCFHIDSDAADVTSYPPSSDVTLHAFDGAGLAHLSCCPSPPQPLSPRRLPPSHHLSHAYTDAYELSPNTVYALTDATDREMNTDVSMSTGTGSGGNVRVGVGLSRPCSRNAFSSSSSTRTLVALEDGGAGNRQDGSSDRDSAGGRMRVDLSPPCEVPAHPIMAHTFWLPPRGEVGSLPPFWDLLPPAIADDLSSATPLSSPRPPSRSPSVSVAVPASSLPLPSTHTSGSRSSQPLLATSDIHHATSATVPVLPSHFNGANDMCIRVEVCAANDTATCTDVSVDSKDMPSKHPAPYPPLPRSPPLTPPQRVSPRPRVRPQSLRTHIAQKGQSGEMPQTSLHTLGSEGNSIVVTAAYDIEDDQSLLAWVQCRSPRSSLSAADDRFANRDTLAGLRRALPAYSSLNDNAHATDKEKDMSATSSDLPMPSSPSFGSIAPMLRTSLSLSHSSSFSSLNSRSLLPAQRGAPLPPIPAQPAYLAHSLPVVTPLQPLVPQPPVPPSHHTAGAQVLSAFPTHLSSPTPLARMGSAHTLADAHTHSLSSRPPIAFPLRHRTLPHLYQYPSPATDTDTMEDSGDTATGDTQRPSSHLRTSSLRPPSTSVGTSDTGSAAGDVATESSDGADVRISKAALRASAPAPSIRAQGAGGASSLLPTLPRLQSVLPACDKHKSLPLLRGLPSLDESVSHAPQTPRSPAPSFMSLSAPPSALPVPTDTQLQQLQNALMNKLIVSRPPPPASSFTATASALNALCANMRTHLDAPLSVFGVHPTTRASLQKTMLQLLPVLTRNRMVPKKVPRRYTKLLAVYQELTRRKAENSVPSDNSGGNGSSGVDGVGGGSDKASQGSHAAMAMVSPRSASPLPSLTSSNLLYMPLHQSALAPHATTGVATTPTTASTPLETLAQPQSTPYAPFRAVARVRSAPITRTARAAPPYASGTTLQDAVPDAAELPLEVLTDTVIAPATAEITAAPLATLQCESTTLCPPVVAAMVEETGEASTTHLAVGQEVCTTTHTDLSIEKENTDQEQTFSETLVPENPTLGHFPEFLFSPLSYPVDQCHIQASVPIPVLLSLSNYLSFFTVLTHVVSAKNEDVSVRCESFATRLPFIRATEHLHRCKHHEDATSGLTSKLYLTARVYAVIDAVEHEVMFERELSPQTLSVPPQMDGYIPRGDVYTPGGTFAGRWVLPGSGVTAPPSSVFIVKAISYRDVLCASDADQSPAFAILPATSETLLGTGLYTVIDKDSPVKVFGALVRARRAFGDSRSAVSLRFNTCVGTCASNSGACASGESLLSDISSESDDMEEEEEEEEEEAVEDREDEAGMMDSDRMASATAPNTATTAPLGALHPHPQGPLATYALPKLITQLADLPAPPRRQLLHLPLTPPTHAQLAVTRTLAVEAAHTAVVATASQHSPSMLLTQEVARCYGLRQDTARTDLSASDVLCRLASDAHAWTASIRRESYAAATEMHVDVSTKMLNREEDTMSDDVGATQVLVESDCARESTDAVYAQVWLSSDDEDEQEEEAHWHRLACLDAHTLFSVPSGAAKTKHNASYASVRIRDPRRQWMHKEVGVEETKSQGEEDVYDGTDSIFYPADSGVGLRGYFCSRRIAGTTSSSDAALGFLERAGISIADNRTILPRDSHLEW